MQNDKLKLKIIFLAIIFGGIFGVAGNSLAACVGPAQPAVVAAVAAASKGDTIQVCAGTATWSTETTGADGYGHLLNITKGIALEGGIGGTTKIIAAGATDRGQILYYPDLDSITSDATFEFSGFTLDGDSTYKAQGSLRIINSSNSNAISNIKIHNNILQNSGVNGTMIMVDGPVYGVIYLNHFINVDYLVRPSGNDSISWGIVPREYGTDVGLFVEDNLVSLTTTMEGGLFDDGQGSPGLVFRYNTEDLTNATLSGLWVNHGLQSMKSSLVTTGTATGGSTTTLIDTAKNFVALGAKVGTLVYNTTKGQYDLITSITTTTNTNDTLHFNAMGSANASGDSYRVGRDWDCGYEGHDLCDPTYINCQEWSNIKLEVYGNKIVNAPAFSNWIAHRGSWLLMFYNDNDSYYKPTITYNQYSCDSCQDPAGQNDGSNYSQHVQNTYTWINYSGGSLMPMTKGFDFCSDASVGSPYTITQNVDYWNYTSSFDGTSGVGCGTLAQMNAINPGSGTNVGVGFWVTNQSCSNVSTLIGAKGVGSENRSDDISGTLYKWNGNAWSVYYTPYTYPHPLRGEADTTSPTSPTGLAVE
ncbi:MAG: hypothetical protein WC848_05535 [Parcubacteria group bacterium]|jgi:hypothetical protein